MKRNISDRPKQYVQGWVEFYKLKFKVNEDALIPRPETELLVEAAIKADPLSVLDIGTGAGNIAIAIAKNLPKVQITATEVSAPALKVAKANAKFHGVDDRIEFVVSDLLNFIPSLGETFSHHETSTGSEMPKQVRHDNKRNYDVIVTNLPYIPSERIAYLDASVKDFEPHVALDGGKDGFELYRKLFAEMVEKLVIPKLLIGEIDYTHGEMAVNVAEKYFPGCHAEVKLDLTHRQRFLVIRF